MIIDLEGKLDAFLIRLARTTSVADAWREVVSHFASLDIEGLVSVLGRADAPYPCVMSAGAEKVATLCTDPAALDRDRSLRHMSTALRPRLLDLGGAAFDPERTPAPDPSADPDGDTDQILAAARAAGFGGGLVVPARFGADAGPGGLILLTYRAGPQFRAYTVEHGLALAYAATQSQMHLGFLQRSLGGDPKGPLTRREREVLSLSARGLTTRDVGEALGISVSGVNFHIANAARKLGANNRTHATSLALAAGHISL